MKTSSLLLFCTALSGATAAGVSAALPARPAAAAAQPIAPQAFEQVASTLAALQREQSRLADSLTELEMRMGLSAGAERQEVGALDAAVARWMEQNAGEVAAAPAAGAKPGGSRDEEPVEAASAFASLLAGELSDVEEQALWKRLGEQGLADEVLALFEQAVDEDPTNPDKRSDLGLAYLNRIQEVGNGPAAGVYATKADQAFDAALEYAPDHWDARFNKAVALSFWPPVFGKQSAAIEQFEHLVQQQSGLAPQGSHATTHLLLGNMYQQIGDAQAALEAWQLGASLFPDDAALAEQLRLNGGG